MCCELRCVNNAQQLHHVASQIYTNTVPQLSQECCHKKLQMHH
jgi:hypothetical protein